MATFGRFGNMNPPAELDEHAYLSSIDPFRIKGNLYFVGSLHCSTHLIDTGDGLIILDVPYASLLPYLVNSIWRAGFDPHDIKYIIISHTHGDHYGSVNAMKRLTGAKTLLSRVDAEDMKNKPAHFARHIAKFGPGNENFTPDILLEDGDEVTLGNTTIRCRLIPGHTVGTMAHFWTLEEGGVTYRVGIYGGSGFISLSDEEIAECGLTPEIRKDFARSIDKVWDEPVDIMLGNHPFHNDTMRKRRELLAGNPDAFVDPTEWHRFLQDLKDKYALYLSMSQQEIADAFVESGFMEYTGRWVDLPADLK